MFPRFFLAVACVTAGCSGAQGTALAVDGGTIGVQLSPCEQFLERVCGDSMGSENSRCSHTSTCEGARLTAQYEQARCQERGADLQNWPDCPPEAPLNNAQPSLAPACRDFLTKVCGPEETDQTRPCDTQEACINAHDVVNSTPIEDPAPCREALGDDTSFPRCMTNN